MASARLYSNLRRTIEPVIRLCAALCIVAACSQPASKTATPDPPPTPAYAAPPTQNLPPGVLARVAGIQGQIQVEERNGLRLLTIDGIVHAAVPLEADGDADPILDLVKSMRPKLRSALVIGLGSGKTAADFGKELRVHAVELEPNVIELAREFFGYEGHAVAQDGLEYLETTKQKYDVVIMDAFSGSAPPKHLVSLDAFRAMRRRMHASGIIVVRMLASPKDESVRNVITRLRETLDGPFSQAFGGGVSDEIQNLYILGSEKPINFVDQPGLPLWPLGLADRGTRVSPDGDAPSDFGRASRRVRLVGYILELAEDGSLALDLPHYEMGAVRYLLSGSASSALKNALPPDTEFPTAGDIASDGDTSRTLKSVLGGGGAKRSDVRFSPVIAAIEGVATLRSLVHPDAASKVPRTLRGKAPTDDRIPYGGALYDLDVDKVYWTLDEAAWAKLERKLAPLRKKAIKKIRSAQLRNAARPLRQYAAVMSKAFKPFEQRVPIYRDTNDIIETLYRESRKLTESSRQLAVGRACDLAAVAATRTTSPGLEQIRGALIDCATSRYRKESETASGDRARKAAARLLFYLDRAGDDEAVSKLEKQFPKLKAASAPPAAN